MKTTLTFALYLLLVFGLEAQASSKSALLRVSRQLECDEDRFTLKPQDPSSTFDEACVNAAVQDAVVFVLLSVSCCMTCTASVTGKM